MWPWDQTSVTNYITVGKSFSIFNVNLHTKKEEKYRGRKGPLMRKHWNKNKTKQKKNQKEKSNFIRSY